MDDRKRVWYLEVVIVELLGFIVTIFILIVSLGLTCMTHCIWFFICGIVVLILMYGILFLDCNEDAGLIALMFVLILALLLFGLWAGAFDEWMVFNGWVWSWHDG